MRHNKRRNSLMLYRMLTHEIASARLRKNEERESVLHNLLLTHFEPNSVLFKDYKLYNSIFELKTSEKSRVREEVRRVKKERGRLDSKELFNSQTRLINEINQVDSSIFGTKIQDYKIIATIDHLVKQKRRFNSDFMDKMVRFAEYNMLDMDEGFRSFINLIQQRYKINIFHDQSRLLKLFYQNKDLGAISDSVDRYRIVSYEKLLLISDAEEVKRDPELKDSIVTYLSALQDFDLKNESHFMTLIYIMSFLNELEIE